LLNLVKSLSCCRKPDIASTQSQKTRAPTWHVVTQQRASPRNCVSFHNVVLFVDVTCSLCLDQCWDHQTHNSAGTTTTEVFKGC